MKKRERIVMACSGGLHLGKKIAKAIKASYDKVKLERFPDTELRIQIPDVSGKQVYFVQSFYPEENDINDKLVEAVFAGQTARELGASKVSLIAPYLAYLREDKRFESGEAISARILAKLFKVFNWAKILKRVSPLIVLILSLLVLKISILRLSGLWQGKHFMAIIGKTC